MNDREKLENLSGVLDDLICTYENEIKISEKELALEWNTDKLQEVCFDLKEFEAKLDILKYIKGFLK